MTKDEIYAQLKDFLVSDFEVDEAKVSLDAALFDDLDLDSIDAVEMVVKMKPFLHGKIEPDVFKSVRTVRDVVSVLEPLAN